MNYTNCFQVGNNTYYFQVGISTDVWNSGDTEICKNFGINIQGKRISLGHINELPKAS